MLGDLAGQFWPLLTLPTTIQMRIFKTVVAATAFAALMPASAAIVVLDFEGVGNMNQVGNFYDGGAGTNYGVSFSLDTKALVDSDAGGFGNFANEPSPSTVMFFEAADGAIMNVAAGFADGLSYFYSSGSVGWVTVYDGLNGTGNVLGKLALAAQYNDKCIGDPNGDFCNWTGAGLAFAGTAMSVNFGGVATGVIYDNVTLGSAIPGIPEPETCVLFALGLAALGLTARRRKA